MKVIWSLENPSTHTVGSYDWALEFRLKDESKYIDTHLLQILFQCLQNGRSHWDNQFQAPLDHSQPKRPYLRLFQQLVFLSQLRSQFLDLCAGLLLVFIRVQSPNNSFCFLQIFFVPERNLHKNKEYEFKHWMYPSEKICIYPRKLRLNMCRSVTIRRLYTRSSLHRILPK